jgi:hypothetical protein
MMALWVTGGIATLFLILGTRRGWVVSITPRPCFTRGERTPGTHCTGGWVGLKAAWTQRVEEKSIASRIGPGRPVRSQSLYWLSYPAYINSGPILGNLRTVFRLAITSPQALLHACYRMFHIRVSCRFVNKVFAPVSYSVFWSKLMNNTYELRQTTVCSV